MSKPLTNSAGGSLRTLLGERGDSHAYSPSEMRILILAPTSNDARLTEEFLAAEGLEAVICRDIPDLCRKMETGCGAVLLAEEAIDQDSIRLLVAELEAQPSWSDLPMVIISSTGEEEMRKQQLEVLGTIGNVSIVERPVRPGTLVRTFQFALRSRRRQYQVRALIEERDLMAASAKQQARIFDTTLSSIPDFTYIFDRVGRFLYANKALIDLLGLRIGEIVGKSFYDLPYPIDLAARLDQQVKRVFETGEVLRDETAYTNPAGVTGYYEYIFSPVFGIDGQVEVVAGSTRDTSERRRSEEALRAADRRKDEFLAMLAHELRNPLASVASAASLLITSPDSDNHRWAAGVIQRQSRQLAHLIDDLLDVSRITTGKIRLRKETVDATAILDRACEAARPLMVERRHKLVCRYLRGSLWLEADPTRIEQIVLNLLTNAAKYTPPSGRIELSAREQENEVIITVRDNGMGIAPERLPEMFQLFAQGERSIARSEGGLGIGLTIVQKLVEMHGGSVDAHSDGPNLGSTFRIRLPAIEAPATAPQLVNEPAKETTMALRILIVDDNVDTANGLARILQRSGHKIELAHDGTQALAKAAETLPHAIMLDIGLPGMDGYQVVQRLRTESPCSDALIIAVTGYGQEEDRQRSRDAGFDHHLVKPVDLDELKKILRSAFL